MAEYIKLFNTHAEYEAYISGQGKLLPNVSYCEDQSDLHYNPENRVIVRYNVTDTSNKTRLTNAFGEIAIQAIDGVAQEHVMTSYTFDAAGMHTVTYMLVDSTAIPNSFLSACVAAKSVEMPMGVTSIGEDAFSGCTGLTSISIPKGVASIGSDAFYGCSGLTSISIPEGVTSVGSSAFQNCKGLTAVTLPSTLVSLSQYMFQSCTALETINIPDNLESVGKMAFSNCMALTAMTLPASITSIGGSCYAYSSNLESVTVLATTPPDLGGGAFYGTSNNLKIYVPAESVNTYKATSGWASFESNITPIGQ